MGEWVDLFKDISIMLGIGAILLKMFAWQRNAGMRDGKLDAEIRHISDVILNVNKQLTNHIPSLISDKIKEVHERINEVIRRQGSCRAEMGDRVGKLEGKLNGKKTS